MSIKVLLVDDHRMMRDGLRAILDQSSEVEVVGDAASGREAIELVEKLRPNIVVMDVGMEEMNGIEATRTIVGQYPVKVVALSTYSDSRYVLAMLDAGASGYVLKANASEELLRAINAVSRGQSYLPSEVAGTVMGRVLGQQPPNDTSAFVALGAREREVLQLLAEGKTSKEIAASMHISFKTVEAHRRNVMRKLGLRGVAELTKYAIREGLTSLEK